MRLPLLVIVDDAHWLDSPSAEALTFAARRLTAESLRFDPDKDFVPVHALISIPNILVVNASRPYGSVQELVNYARANPGKLVVASAGNGTGTHLSAELFQTVAGVKFVHVPYRGSAPAINDLLGGQVDLSFDYPITTLGHVQAAKLKALAVTSSTRAPTLPDVPTTAEMNYPNVTSDNWYGLVVPAATPADIQKRLNAAAVAALKSPALTEQYAKVGGLASPGTQQDYAAFLAKEQEKWSRVVSAIGFKEQSQ